MNHSVPSIIPHTDSCYPTCPSCKRECTPYASWPGANYCRGRVLLPWIARQPGLSAWELAQASGLSYEDTQRALIKLRQGGLVLTASEPRAQGDGFRYRYTLSDDQDAFEGFLRRPCSD
jgi:hypothetical protein